MEYQVDKEGFLLGEDGNRLEISGEPVQAKNFMSQESIDNKIQERLARQKKEYQEQIKSLEAQANKTPELQELLNSTKEKLTGVEKELGEAKQKAQSEVAEQMKELRTKAEEAEKKLQETQNSWLREQVTNKILANVSDKETGKQLFINPTEDLVPRMLGRHKREPKKDDSGQPIEGEFVDLFETEVFDKEKNSTEVKFLPVDKAVNAFASNPKYRHYLNGNNASGPSTNNTNKFVGPNKTGEDSKPFGVSRIAKGLKEQQNQ